MRSSAGLSPDGSLGMEVEAFRRSAFASLAGGSGRAWHHRILHKMSRWREECQDQAR